MANTERRSKTRRGIFTAIALVLIVYLIGATYARYSTEHSATAKVDIAKWKVVMTPNDGLGALTTTRDIKFVVQNNTNVVPNKIAPAVTAVAEVELDLTGTEVAVDFTATLGDIDKSALAAKDNITFTTAIEGATQGSNTQTIPLVNEQAFTAENGKRKVTLTLTWEDKNTAAENEKDTTTGIAGGTLTVPVTLTAVQHVQPAQQP